ncbi:MAG TPA: right-handed parallel beta-helix repeat-containing protein [Conexibacter sp.]|nr:right-handed parallel beta-helix repeat-containing protein [Conexibacter sp.]
MALFIAIALTVSIASSANEQATTAKRPHATYVVSPSGNDWGPGTAERPWRTLRRADRAARPGSTIVLRRGAYGERGRETHLRGDGLMWRSALGERAFLRGKHYLDGAGSRFTRLTFDGPTGDVDGNGCNDESVLVDIRGYGVRIDHSEVRKSRGHAGIYVSEFPRGVRIDNNWIHDNGCFGDQETENHDHGIYFASGSGWITDNLIERNYSRGISLHYEPSHVIVENNRILRNGRQGILVDTDEGGIRIANNLIAYNGYQSGNDHEVAGIAYVRGDDVELIDNVFRENIGGPVSGVPDGP